jgi:hypothetical protein
MRRYLPHFLVLFVLMSAVGYAAGFASSHFGVSAAGLIVTFGSALILVEKRARTRKARAGAWATLAGGAWALTFALLPGAGSLAYAAPVVAGAVFTVLNRPKRRRRRPRLGPPGPVNRLSQPSSGDG